MPVINSSSDEAELGDDSNDDGDAEDVIGSRRRRSSRGVISYNEYKEDEEEDNDDDDDSDNDDENFIHLIDSNSIHRTPIVYGVAYGFVNQPWGPSEIVVCSHILTFTNHGCNGTANIGWNVPNKTEFTLDVAADNFEIPTEFLDKVISNPYSPHRDRSYQRDQTGIDAVHVPIYKGQELFDNYLFFDSNENFIEYALSLRAECSGGLGYVEEQQNRGKQHKMKTNKGGGGLAKQHQEEKHQPKGQSSSSTVNGSKPNNDGVVDEEDNNNDDDTDTASSVDSRKSSSSNDEL